MILQLIGTVDYLPYVSSLLITLQRHNVAYDCSVLITDITRDHMNEITHYFDNKVDLLCCEDLDIDFIRSMREYYSALEFNAACKILAVDYQFRKKKKESCLVIDADMYCLSDISSSFESIESDIVVYPHALSPFPHDLSLPSDIEIILTGHINGGLVYFKNTEKSLCAIDWLKSNVKYQFFISPKHGMHAEQHWLSALPFFFSDITLVSNDKTVNIAYWNLHERNLYENDGLIMVEGKRAKLIHFSGFPMLSKGRFTKYTDRRFSDQTEIILRKLSLEYESLINHEIERFSGVKGNIHFNKDVLFKRMEKAKEIRNIEYRELYPSYGLFESVGKRLDEYFSRKKKRAK